MKKRKHGFLNVAVCSALGICSMLTGCDEAYDLNNMTDDVHLFGNGVTIPLGETTKFYLSDFIAEDSTLVMEDGSYKIKFDGDANTSFSVPELVIDPLVPDIPPSIIDFYESIGDQFPEVKAILDMIGYHKGDPIPDVPGGIHITKHIEAVIADASEVFELKVHDIPEEVKNVQSILVAQTSDISLTLESHGMPDDVKHVYLDFHFTVPEQFTVTPLHDEVEALGNNKYIYKHHVECENGSFSTEIPLHLNKIEFNPPIERQSDGTFAVNLEIAYGGSIEVEDPDVNLVGWTPVTELDIVFRSTALEATEVTACVQAEIPVIDFSQKIEGLPDILSDPDTRLDLQVATMNINIQNSAPVMVEATFEMRSLFFDGTYSPWVTTAEPLTVGAQSTEHIVVTNDTEYAGTPGYIHNLNELLSRVPQELCGIATPYMPATDVTIHLGQTYDILIDYDIAVSLAFGDSVNLHFGDEIAGLSDDISAFTDYITHIILRGDAISTLPLNLAMTMTPLDVNKKEIEGLIVSKVPAIKGNGTTAIEIMIEETTKGALKHLDALRYELSGTSETGGELRADQYLQLTKLSLELPEGIEISLSGE